MTTNPNTAQRIADAALDAGQHSDDGLHVASVHGRCGAEHRARLAQKAGIA